LLVLAGNEAGLKAFEAAVPPAQGRFPMRLGNHAAFHTALQAPVAAQGRAGLPEPCWGSPPAADRRARGDLVARRPTPPACATTRLAIR
jgi:[acyl-carrier-protein] S-malonyltransferase